MNRGVRVVTDFCQCQDADIKLVHDSSIFWRRSPRLLCFAAGLLGEPPALDPLAERCRSVPQICAQRSAESLPPTLKPAAPIPFCLGKPGCEACTSPETATSDAAAHLGEP